MKNILYSFIFIYRTKAAYQTALYRNNYAYLSTNSKGYIVVLNYVIRIGKDKVVNLTNIQ